LILHAPSAEAAGDLDDTVEAIKSARKALEPISGFIQEEKWDKCRTTLNNPPLGFTGTGTVKDKMDQAAKLLPKNLSGAAKGLGQDVLTNIRLLDTFCYNNVFIDEGRQVLGVKIDKKTPLNYLKQSKETLDEYLEMFP